MNSAEKKAPEPSMDDIISSIRNIIADDTQETATPAVPAAQEAPPVVQLTENQIADPVTKAPSPDDLLPDDPAPASGMEAEDVFAAAQTASEMQIANEIVAVPGMDPAPAPAATQAPEPPASVAPSPDLDIFDAAAPVPEMSTPDPVAEEPAEVAPAPVASEPVIPAEQPVAAKAPEPPVAPAPQQENAVKTPVADVNEAAAAPSIATNPPDRVLMEQDAAPVVDPVPADTALAADPSVEKMPGQTDTSLENSFPDDGGKSDEAESIAAVDEKSETPAAAEENVASPVAEAAQAAMPEPVVLDASKVSPEDAAAITAVAAATSEALSGTKEPEPKEENCNTLEDSIKAMLKPMIREWLDDNMPRILEKAVSEEVQGAGRKDT